MPPSQDVLAIGKRAVLEALASPNLIDTIYWDAQKQAKNFEKILWQAKQQNIVVKEVSSKKLDFLCENESHQGIAAVLATISYAQVSDMLALARQRGEAPFLILADCIQDPHNLGAIIRTAESMGAHGLILPKRNSATVNATVSKTSAGAAYHLPIARVTNLTNQIKQLKEEGLWIYGADMAGQPVADIQFKGGTALVIGAEGEGLHRLVKETCDVLVSIPMRGKINSLNASVASGILMYQITEQLK